MELDAATFICGDGGGKTNVQFRPDRIVAERNKCYRYRKSFLPAAKPRRSMNPLLGSGRSRGFVLGACFFRDIRTSLLPKLFAFVATGLCHHCPLLMIKERLLVDEYPTQTGRSRCKFRSGRWWPSTSSRTLSVRRGRGASAAFCACAVGGRREERRRLLSTGATPSRSTTCTGRRSVTVHQTSRLSGHFPSSIKPVGSKKPIVHMTVAVIARHQNVTANL